MRLDLTSEIVAGLDTLASKVGLSIEVYLEQLIQRELPSESASLSASAPPYLQMENGLLVYRTGSRLQAELIDDAVEQSRIARALEILGSSS